MKPPALLCVVDKFFLFYVQVKTNLTEISTKNPGIPAVKLHFGIVILASAGQYIPFQISLSSFGAT